MTNCVDYCSDSPAQVDLMDSGRLVTTGLLDREATPALPFSIQCDVIRSDGHQVVQVTRDFTLLIIDENDNAPQLQGPEDQLFHVYLKGRAVVSVRTNFDLIVTS